MVPPWAGAAAGREKATDAEPVRPQRSGRSGGRLRRWPRGKRPVLTKQLVQTNFPGRRDGRLQPRCTPPLRSFRAKRSISGPGWSLFVPGCCRCVRARDGRDQPDLSRETPGFVHLGERGAATWNLFAAIATAGRAVRRSGLDRGRLGGGARDSARVGACRSGVGLPAARHLAVLVTQQQITQQQKTAGRQGKSPAARPHPERKFRRVPSRASARAGRVRFPPVCGPWFPGRATS